MIQIQNNKHITILKHNSDESFDDEFGHEINYYNKLFPAGEYFSYKSQYGGLIKIKSGGIHTVSDITRNISVYSVIGPHSNYEVENCISNIREKKLKRILGDDETNENK